MAHPVSQSMGVIWELSPPPPQDRTRMGLRGACVPKDQIIGFFDPLMSVFVQQS